MNRKSVTKVDSPLRGKKKRMIDALEKSLGVVTSACKMAGISRNLHYRWCKEDPVYKAAVEDMQDIALDFVETQNFQGIKNGDASLIKYYLSTKGRKRGYVQRQEIEFDVSEEVKQLEWRITSPNRANGNGKPKHSNGHISK